MAGLPQINIFAYLNGYLERIRKSTSSFQRLNSFNYIIGLKSKPQLVGWFEKSVGNILKINWK